jgi:hypothetical protein
MKSKMDRYREELAVGADFAGETVFEAVADNGFSELANHSLSDCSSR